MTRSAATLGWLMANSKAMKDSVGTIRHSGFREVDGRPQKSFNFSRFILCLFFFRRGENSPIYDFVRVFSRELNLKTIYPRR